MFESDTRYTKYFIKRNLTGLSLSDKSSSQDEISEERSDQTPPSEQQQQSQDRDQEEKQMQDRTQTPAEDCTDNFRSRINSIKRKTVPLYEVIINGISIIFRFVGIVFSVIVGINYHYKGRWDYMTYTIMCLIIPILMTSLISIELHKQDLKKRQKAIDKNTHVSTLSTSTVTVVSPTSSSTPLKPASVSSPGCCHFLFGVIVVPCLFRYWLSFWYSMKSYLAQDENNQQKQRLYYKKMVQQDSDVTFLRLFDTFIEVAPQKVLQIAIYLAGEEDIGMMQAILITSCFISMAWCMGSYHKCLRLAQPDKKNMKFTGIIFHLLFNFFLSVSRTLSISLVASIFPLWTLAAVLIHVLFMGNFIYCFDKPNFCVQNCFTNYLFSLMLGTVFLFHFIATNEGPQKYKLMFFYVVCSLENLACSVIFYIYVNKYLNPYYHLYLIIVWICFVFGLIFKVIYYTRFHPNITARQSLKCKSPSSVTVSPAPTSPIIPNGGSKLDKDPETAVNHTITHIHS